MKDFRIFTPDFTLITMPKYYYIGIEFLKKIDDRGGVTYPNMFQQIEHKVKENRDYLILSYIDKPIVEQIAHLDDILMILPCGIAKIISSQEFTKIRADRLQLLSKVKEYTEQARLEWLSVETSMNTTVKRKEEKLANEKSRTRDSRMDESDRIKTKSTGIKRGKKSTKNTTI